MVFVGRDVRECLCACVVEKDYKKRSLVLSKDIKSQRSQGDTKDPPDLQWHSGYINIPGIKWHNNQAWFCILPFYILI